MYGLEDPLECLFRDPPKKHEYKEIIMTKITAFHEQELRRHAKSTLKYLNVSVSGLRGKHHPSLSNLLTTHDVQKSVPHIKMLCENYFTYEIRANQSGGSPHCRCCSEPNQSVKPSENLTHIITECAAYSDIRDRIYPEFSLLCQQSKSTVIFEDISTNKDDLCQFILEPCSLNLTNRVNIKDPNLNQFFSLSRDFCFAIHSRRMQILKKKNECSTSPTKK